MTHPWLASNPRAKPDLAFGLAQRAVIDPTRVPDVAALPGGALGPTPLLPLPHLAAELGLGEIRIKDESRRMGFGAFKALGGVFAVRDHLATHRDLDPAKAMFATASSGNHGRAVAWGAQTVGARCTIFLPKFTSAAKEAAIRDKGAAVVRVDGDYEAAVADCRRRAEAEGWIIVSDTSWEGYEEIPKSVMRGYTVLAEEALRQWPTGPTHVFVQAGVGGLAAAVVGHLWARCRARPTFVVVEPESADCWFQSNLAGQPALASGNAQTVMGGLACREISPLTWPVVGLGADWFMTIGEASVLPARRRLAHPLDGDPAVASGPSGCAGLAGLLRACGDAAARESMGLDHSACVLLINSEGELGEAPA